MKPICGHKTLIFSTSTLKNMGITLDQANTQNYQLQTLGILLSFRQHWYLT